MASLRRTRRFSSSPTPQGPQQPQHQSQESYYRNSPVPEISIPSSAAHACEISGVRSEGQSRYVKKTKSQLAVKHSHVGDDDGRENEAHNIIRDVSLGGVESRGRQKRHGKGVRSQSARPRDLNDVVDRTLASLETTASDDDDQRIPAQPSLFLVPKSRSRSESRSISPMPSYYAPHTRGEESSLSSISQSYQPAGIKLRPRSKGRRKESSRSRSSSSSEDAVTQKLYSSGLPVPSCRATSPFPPQPPTFNIPSADSSSRTQHSNCSPSPAVQVSARAHSALSSLPLSTRREISKHQSGDTLINLPSRSRAQSRTPQASPVPVSSQPSAISAPRTLKDVTRLLEENRGRLPRQDPSHRLDSAGHHLGNTLDQQYSLSSTPMPSGKKSLHGELDVSMLSPGDDANALAQRSRHTRPGYGLALMNENGHALGEPSFEQGAQTSQLRPSRRGTTIEASAPPKSNLSRNVSARRPGASSGSDSLKRSNDKHNRSTAAHDASSSSSCILHGRDRVTSQVSAILTRGDSEPTEHHFLPRDRSRSNTPLPLSHGTQTKEREDSHQGASNHDHVSGASHLDTPPTPTAPAFSSSGHPKPFPKPILVSRRPPTPVRSTFSTLPTSRPPHIETSLPHERSGSDTSSSSLPRQRKLVVRNLSSNDRISSPTSSNPGTPKSNSAATSRDFTSLAFSTSQTTQGQANENDYVVPDAVATATEIANNEERRRKALAGLVHDLHLVNDDHDSEQLTRKRPKISPSRDLQDMCFSRGESYRDQADDDEEDDDAFFARLSMHNDEGSLLEEPEPEADSGFKDDDNDVEERSDFDVETETEIGGDEDEDPPLPPTPKFVHPLAEGDDLESRITRVTSLNRISPTPLLSRCCRPEQGQQRRPRPETPPISKQTTLMPSRERGNRVRTADVQAVSEHTERSSPRSRVDTRLAETSDTKGIEALPEGTKRRAINPPFTGFAQEAISPSGSQSGALVSDNELSVIDGGRLLDAGTGTEEALSSGAEALFRQLQVEAEAQEAAEIGRVENATSNHAHSHGGTSRISEGRSSCQPTADNRLESQNSIFVNTHEPISLRTWRSTLPLGAYDSLAERHGPSEMRRQEIIWELCETEQAFVKSLRLILRLFVQPLRHEDRTWIPGVPRDVSRLFDWFDDIMHLHSQMSSALHAARSTQYPVVIGIAETLRPFVPRLELHQPYLVRLESVSSAIEAMSKDMHNDFGEFIRIQTASPECESMNLPSFLLKPVQRLMKYTLFFKQLWELTPRSHPDHLPTFSLLHSTDMIIRVMQEVKVREEEYELVKNLASRIKGLPSGYQLARRERRLVAQGLLRRVVLSDKERKALEAAADARQSQSPQKMSTRLTSASSENSSFSGDWTYHPSRTGNIETSGTDPSLHAESITSDASLDSSTNGSTNVSRSNSRSTSRSRSSSLRGPLRHKSKESSVYAFVFTDLIILTTPMSERMHLLRSPKNANDGKETWKLIDDVGVSRVLGVSDQSGQLSNYEHLITVELMSMTPHLLESGAFSDGATAVPVYLSIPDQRVSSTENSYDVFAETKAKWLDAFERCFRFTLRSLSFPSYAGKYGTNTGSTDLELDTKSSVMSILSSGLPLPMSPSQQLDEAQRGRQADLVQEEREERGWWSLRFHQVLKEVQRSSRSPVLDAAPSRKSDTRSKLQGGKRSEPRPLILSPNPSRKVGLLSLRRKKSK